MAIGSSKAQDSEQEIFDWTDLGQKMWSYLTGRGAAINYTFVDMAVEVPRDTGPNAARATWVLHGTLQITTSDNAGLVETGSESTGRSSRA